VPEPLVVVVMGVSGSGKTTLAAALADALGCDFLEGDALHPPANVAKMARGEPLTDDDRRPWLETIGSWIDVRRGLGRRAVVTCSALRRSYRDTLRAGRPGVRFCLVAVSPEALAERLKTRRGHYMPASLLPSQLATLEPLEPDEPGVTISGDGTPDEVLRTALAALGLDGYGHSAGDQRLP
jgi:gluconokinase